MQIDAKFRIILIVIGYGPISHGIKVVPTMSRQKQDTQRMQISMKIKRHILKYVKIRAIVFGVGANTIIEDAVNRLLDTTRKMDKFDIYALVYSPVKLKRVPFTTLLDKGILDASRALAKRIGVAFAEVVEAAIVDRIHADMTAIQKGELVAEALEGAFTQYFNSETQGSKEVLKDF